MAEGAFLPRLGFFVPLSVSMPSACMAGLISYNMCACVIFGTVQGDIQYWQPIHKNETHLLIPHVHHVNHTHRSSLQASKEDSFQELHPFVARPAMSAAGRWWDDERFGCQLFFSTFMDKFAQRISKD